MSSTNVVAITTAASTVIQRALMAASLPLAVEELLEKVKEQEFE